MSRPLSIAFIGGRGVGNTYSGIETYYEELGTRLAARGHRVTAYCRNHFTPAVMEHNGIQIRRFAAIRTKHLETISHSLLATLDSFRYEYDLIQYHAIGSAPFAMLPRLMGRRTIVSVRGLDWQRAKWGAFARTILKIGEKASVHCPTATVVVSNTLQRHYANHGHEVRFIPNAVVPPVFRDPRVIASRGLGHRDFILYAGRISPEKGVLELVNALRPFAGRIKLAIAGSGGYGSDYVDRVKRAAWGDVVFLGNVGRTVMQELLSNCYAYVLPSVMEGLSVSLLEALSYGNCVLATSIPENVEVMESAALTFEPGDVDGLNRLVGHILDNPTTAEEFRARATQRARQWPNWDAVAVLTEAFYYEILGLVPGPVDNSARPDPWSGDQPRTLLQDP